MIDLRVVGLLAAALLGCPFGALGQPPTVVTYSEQGFIGEIMAVSEMEPGSRCSLYMLVERREWEEPIPNWAVKRFNEMRLCVPARVGGIKIAVWTAARTVRSGTLDELRPGVQVRVSLGGGIFMTEPPTADALGVEILEYVKKPEAKASGAGHGA